MASYWELLKHPKWQARRLEVLQRAGFACEYCGDKETTLHVDHTYYEKGAKPWEYPDRALQCLCESCHGILHEFRDQLKYILGALSKHRAKELVRVLGYATALLAQREVEEEPQAAYVEVMPWEMEGFADYFGLTVDELVALQLEPELRKDYFAFDFYDVKRQDPRSGKGVVVGLRTESTDPGPKRTP